jgi:hypothetical protein
MQLFSAKPQVLRVGQQLTNDFKAVFGDVATFPENPVFRLGATILFVLRVAVLGMSKLWLEQRGPKPNIGLISFAKTHLTKRNEGGIAVTNPPFCVGHR